MQSFIISDDKIGRWIFAALMRQARRGVSVHVIYDSFGSFSAIVSHFFKRYTQRSPNLKIRAFSHASLFTPWRFQLRNHRKLLLTDGKLAFIGGLNISDENFSFKRKKRTIHDLHFRVTGPAVSKLQLSFLNDWCIATKQAPEQVFLHEYFPAPHKTGENVVRVIPSGHGYCYQGTQQTFLAAAISAKKSLWIYTPYFVPDNAFLSMISMAALRGVDVRILLPKNNNHWFMKMASRNLYHPLLDAGVRILEREGDFSHAKAMLIDGEWAYFGSSNCDIRSFRLNYELDLIVTSGPIMTQLFVQFQTEFQASNEVSLHDVEKQSIVARFIQSACSLLNPIL